MKELISIDEIECPEIKENIFICEKELLKFAEVIRKHIRIAACQEIYSVNEMLKVQEEFPVLRKERMYTQITVEKGTGYIGNTPVVDNDYQVIWAFDLIGNEIKSNTLFDFDKQWIEKTLYFTYEQSEHLPFHEADRGRFFSVFVAGLGYSEDGTIEKQHFNIAHNNDNCDLTSILNSKVATRTIQEINKVLDEYLLFKKVNKEFEDC
ncbi:hypothetical protein [Lacrimispora amygdalina]|uniref:hypothetical protein n=1 Tax=Lacrimispora amygdalina TaxID=253257 RepID=UPI000BE269A1|nr:hypothetical protein [Lacrimispora amygdalina]